MKRKPTNELILAKLSQLKSVSDIEKDAGLARGRIGDVKRGKAKLSPDELGRVAKALSFMK